MGKKSPSAPAAPDPAATAAAQTAQNKETAYWNAALNNVNQITPYGSLTYEQTGGGKKYNMDAYNQALASYNSAPNTGNISWTNPNNGRKYEVRDGALYDSGIYGGQVGQGTDLRQYGYTGDPYSPSSRGTAPKLDDFFIGESPPQFTSTVKLTPEQQAILDRTQANEKALVDLGGQQLGRISESVNTPFSYAGIPSYGEQDQTAAAARAEEALMARMNPQFQRDEEALRTRLINQGIGQGSQAYQREMESFNQARNDARTQAILSGQQYGSRELADALQRRNQGIQEYTTQRNAPLNEYIGLTSGVQVQNPQFSSQGYQGAQPVDYAGLVNNQYQANLGAYNSKIASNNATQGALLGLGGQLGGSFLGSKAGSAAIAGLFSDKRLKKNIEPIGIVGRHVLYKFEYNQDWLPKGKFIGVLAQDVEKYMPEAISEVDGYMAVNYDMLGLEMRSA